MKYSLDVTFPSLALYLHSYGFGEHLDEITYHVLHSSVNENKIPIRDWTSIQFCSWVDSLEFLKECSSLIVKVLEQEEIDGFTFLQMTEHDWTQSLGLDLHHFILLRCIREGWTTGWGEPISIPKGVPAGLVTNIMADLSQCTPERASALVQADEDCIQTGRGNCYGQLVVLGYKEYHINGDSFQAVGPSNAKYALFRRTVPNGVNLSIDNKQQIAAQKPLYSIVPKNLFKIKCSSKEVIAYAYGDPGWDMYQIGRLAEPHNDFVVKGPLHTDTTGQQCGPISRLACRILCERVAPFRCFLFAGGFNVHQELTLTGPLITDNESLNQYNGNCLAHNWSTFDALTTYGIKLWRPEVNSWCEVSVRGQPFTPRVTLDGPGSRLSHPFTNELTDGAIIDLCGVALLFQGPHTVAKQSQVTCSIHRRGHSQKVIAQLNALRPQCPVQLHRIQFVFTSTRERALRAISRMEAAGEAFIPAGPFHIPPSDYTEVIPEERRAYVYPACGHVHGYHRSLDGQPCPLCRTQGPFVPVAFAFESAICSRKPTHVFNPCGHVASKQTCRLWASLPIHDASPSPSPSGSAETATVLHPHCPFCAKPLVHEATQGGPFNRMIVQFEPIGLTQAREKGQQHAACWESESDTTSDTSSDGAMIAAQYGGDMDKQEGRVNRRRSEKTAMSIEPAERAGDARIEMCLRSSRTVQVKSEILVEGYSHDHDTFDHGAKVTTEDSYTASSDPAPTFRHQTSVAAHAAVGWRRPFILRQSFPKYAPQLQSHSLTIGTPATFTPAVSYTEVTIATRK